MNPDFPKSLPRPTIPPDAARAAAIIDGIRASTTLATTAYQDRRSGRADRYAELASKAAREASAGFDAARKSIEHIPFGQPILVGHHSEKRHRRDLARHDSLMDRACETHRKAEHYAGKAEAAGSNDAISADDPEALKKLREKLAELEETQAAMKAVNAAHKRFLKDPASLEAADLPGRYKERIRSYVPSYSWEPHPFPPYAMSNNNANIRRVRERIEQLSRRRASAPKADRVADGVRIADNAEANRVQVFFPGKPDEATRKRLKSFGFRWSPSEGAWQAYRNNRTEYALAQLFPGL